MAILQDPFTKQQLNVVKFFKLPMPLTGNAYAFGRIGSGKTCKLMTIFHHYILNGYKGWDIFGGKRQEGGFQCFPSDDYALWEQTQHEIGYDFKNQGPVEMKVNLIYPLFQKQLPKKIPNYPPRIKSKIFTIPFSEITERDITFVLGPLSNRDKILFNKLKDELDTKCNGRDIKFLYDTKYKKQKQYALFQLFFKPLIENNFISSDNCSLNLDLEAEAKEINVISVLQLEYVPEKFHLFIMGNILRRLFQLCIDNKIHKKNIAFFREASYFMKVIDSDKTKEEIVNAFRNLIVEIARYGRSGLFEFLDSQDSNEVKGMIEGADDILVLNEMPSPTSREVTCDPLRKDRRMNSAQIRYIATMPIHQSCIVTRGKKAVILKRIQPPRTRYWKSQYGDFFSLWAKEYDKWILVREFLDIIEVEYRNRDDICVARTPVEVENLDDEDEGVEEDISGVTIKSVKSKEEVNYQDGNAKEFVNMDLEKGLSEETKEIFDNELNNVTKNGKPKRKFRWK
jgi:hypothetical protein